MTKKKHKVLPTDMLDSFKYIVAEELGLLNGKTDNWTNNTGSTDIRAGNMPDSSGVAEYYPAEDDDEGFTGE